MAGLTVYDLVCHFYLESEELEKFYAVPLSAPSSLEASREGTFTFFAKGNLARQEKNPELCQASACFVHPQEALRLPKTIAALKVERPYRCFLEAIEKWFFPPSLCPQIHPRAFVDPAAKVPASCYVGACAVIEEGVILGEGCVIQSGATLKAPLTLGDYVSVGASSTLSHAVIGAHTVIGSGACIGQPGFGFLVDDLGFKDIPHLGLVRIGKNVRIGCNTTIDRGSFEDTIIGDHCRLDNLVQIAHNVQLGKGVIMASQCGIAGSCRIGDGCVLGGQVGLADHVVLAPGTKVAAKSGVMRSGKAGETLAGIPAVPLAQWKRTLLRQGYGRKGS